MPPPPQEPPPPHPLDLPAVIAYAIRLYRESDPVRERALADLAERLGLRFSRTDPFSVKALPFELMQTGGPAWVRNVMWGEHLGQWMTAFEYRRRSREVIAGKETPRAFSCVVSQVPLRAPHVKIERQATEAFQFGRAIGAAPVVKTESLEFDRAFVVRSDDSAFALALLDPAVMGWLLETPGNWSFEIDGGRLLCYSPLVEPAELERLFSALDHLHDLVPALVRSLGRPGADFEVAPEFMPGRRRPIRVADLAFIGCFVLVFSVPLALWFVLYVAGRVGPPP